MGACGSGGCLYGIFTKQIDHNYHLAFNDYLKNKEIKTKADGTYAFYSYEEITAYDTSKIQVSVYEIKKAMSHYTLDTTYVHHEK